MCFIETFWLEPQAVVTCSSEVNMELEQEDGNLVPIEFGSATFIGRELGLGLGPSSPDRSISRHQVSLQFLDSWDTIDQPVELLLSFEVVGKNPILVCGKDGEGKRIYRRSEKGVLKAGDRISLSIKSPNFFTVKRREGTKGVVESNVFDALLEQVAGENEEVALEGSVLEIGSLDVSEIDPVKEFGFLVKGHEFDHYPRKKIRPVKDWSWFLEGPQCLSTEDDEEDEAVGTSSKGKHQRKKKRGGDDDDDDWAGEDENVSTLTAKPVSAKRPRNSTRSKDPKKPQANVWDSNKHVKKGFNGQQKEHDNENDETMGGFIVGDDDIEEEEEQEEVLEEETEEEEEEGDDEESDVD